MFYVLLVLLLFLVFFVIYSRGLVVLDKKRNQDRRREIKKAYRRLINRYRLSISSSDRFDDRLIAIDRVLGKLVLIVYRDGITWERVLDMDELVFCHVVKTVNESTGYIQQVVMELTFRNTSGTVNFVFYDESYDEASVLSQRVKRSQHWKREIQFQLSAQEVTRAGRQGDGSMPGMGYLPQYRA